MGGGLAAAGRLQGLPDSGKVMALPARPFSRASPVPWPLGPLATSHEPLAAGEGGGPALS